MPTLNNQCFVHFRGNNKLSRPDLSQQSLCLKSVHKRNRVRIVTEFIGSPITQDEAEFDDYEGCARGSCFWWLWSVALDRPQIRCSILGLEDSTPAPSFTRISSFNSEPRYFLPFAAETAADAEFTSTPRGLPVKAPGLAYAASE